MGHSATMRLFRSPEDQAREYATRQMQRQQHEERRSNERAQRQQTERWQAYMASPAGAARVAFERGDPIFQTQIELSSQRPRYVATPGNPVAADASDPNPLLAAISREGWDLVGFSTAFVEEVIQGGKVNLVRGASVRGRLLGFYVFRRSERGGAPA